MKMFVLRAKVKFPLQTEERIHFVKDRLGESVESRWGSFRILEDSLDCDWHYSDAKSAESDYESISQMLDSMKNASIVSSFIATVGE